jgi:hypothetical protein
LVQALRVFFPHSATALAFSCSCAVDSPGSRQEGSGSARYHVADRSGERFVAE